MMPTRLWLSLALLLPLAACVEDNPRACGEDDPCRDPAFPFCDSQGLVGGLPGACVAADCTPGEFVVCDGDRAIQCNAAGDNYESVLCERGCDPESHGCRLCDPNETACTNGITATCDANGAVIDSEVCALGCFESEPRCRDVDPSNGLATYLDMAADAPAIDVVGRLVVDTKNGTIFSADTNGILAVPSFLIPAAAGGVPVRVFLANSATVGDVAFSVYENLNAAPPAAAFVVAGDLIIRGTVNAGIGYVTQFEFGPQGPGSLISGACVGEGGRIDQPGVLDPLHVVGAGGGGNATPGSRGGGLADGVAIGGAGGAAIGSVSIEPLVGGCAGGPLRNAVGGITAQYTGAGGGALQLVSGTRIMLQDGGSVLANGAGGYDQTNGAAAGGAGGSILLEAPTVELSAGSAIAANGGSGGGGDIADGATPGNDGLRSTDRAPGVLPTGPACAPPAACGRSGAGGALAGPPTDGAFAGYDPNNDRFAGGGGGAAGRIRINTKDGNYAKASDVIESPAVSAGTLRTR